MSILAALPELRVALADALADKTGLVVAPYPPDLPAAPCGWVEWPARTVTLTDDLGAGCIDPFEVQLRVRWAVPRAQADAGPLLDGLTDLTLDVVTILDGVTGPYEWAPPRPVVFGNVTVLVTDITISADL